MRPNRALSRLRADEPAFGPLLALGSPDLAEQVAHMGFDWAFLDWQHGEWTESTLNNALARFLHADCTPIVRVKGHEPGTINRVLDMGAMGVIVPMVEEAEQAQAAVRAARYPPLGLRSGGGNRLGLMADGGTPGYFTRANGEVMVVVMVETERGVENVDELMAVPGVDAVLIGPGDLMLDVRSRGGDEAHRERLVERVAAAGRRRGVPVGFTCSTREVVEQRIAQGFRLINYLSDSGAVLSGLRAGLAGVARPA